MPIATNAFINEKNPAGNNQIYIRRQDGAAMSLLTGQAAYAGNPDQPGFYTDCEVGVIDPSGSLTHADPDDPDSDTVHARRSLITVLSVIPYFLQGWPLDRVNRVLNMDVPVVPTEVN